MQTPANPLATAVNGFNDSGSVFSPFALTGENMINSLICCLSSCNLIIFSSNLNHHLYGIQANMGLSDLQSLAF